VITDARLPRTRLLAQLGRAAEAGTEVGIQCRLPGAPIRELLSLAEDVMKLCTPRGNPVFINGRLDLAVALNAHLHLPSRGPRAAECRPFMAGRWISVAVHYASEAADAAGADLALVSPVYAPTSKPTDARPPLGEAGFAALARALDCPAYALGGLTAARAATLRAPGAAAIGAILDADDPLEAARAFLAVVPERAIVPP